MWTDVLLTLTWRRFLEPTTDHWVSTIVLGDTALFVDAVKLTDLVSAEKEATVQFFRELSEDYWSLSAFLQKRVTRLSESDARPNADIVIVRGEGETELFVFVTLAAEYG